MYVDNAAMQLVRDPGQFDTIVTGTRAYAVREDLKTYHQRVLEYVRQGGNLVVLYNTQELIPARFAPFPAEHGPRAEEVSEEDAAVRILAPTAPVMTWPTASPRPTSMAGSSSGARSSGRRGTPRIPR